MKKKILISILLLFSLFIYKGVIKKEENNTLLSYSEEVKCYPLTGGSYNLNYNTNGGDFIASERVCIACGNTDKLPVPIKIGYEFMGWYYDSSLSSKVKSDYKSSVNTIKNIDENGCLVGYLPVTLYASWEKNSIECLPYNGGSFKLNYNTDGGDSISSESVCVACGNFEILPVPTKKGYSFTGWYYDSSLTKKLLGNDKSSIKLSPKTNEDGCLVGYNPITIYASWEKISNECLPYNGGSFRLYYETNGGNSISSESVCVACGNFESLPIPTKIGYDFAGWYYDSSLTKKLSENYKSGIKLSPKINENGCHVGYNPITIYASWKNGQCDPLNGGSFKLNYNTNGGNKINTESVCVACEPSAYHLLPIPEKEGYTFDGWYYDQELKDKLYVNNTIEVKYNPKYNFEGCHVGYYEVTLNAKWIKGESSTKCTSFATGGYSLFYESNGGTQISTEGVCVGCGIDSYHKLDTPTKEGFLFGGWYYDGEFKNKVNTNSTLDIIPIQDIDTDGCVKGYKAITLYAKWVSNKTATIKGILTDNNGKSLRRHIIELHSDVITSTTDVSGEYILPNVIEGNHELYVKDSDGNIIDNLDINIEYKNTLDKTTYSYNESNPEIIINLEIINNKLYIENGGMVNNTIVKIGLLIMTLIVFTIILLILKKKKEKLVK